MIFPWSTDDAKAAHHKAKGDSFLARGLARKAYESYKNAAGYADLSEDLAGKLISSMEAIKDDWSEEDFVEHIYWTMRQQELVDPTFKRIHFRAEPEFQEVTKLIQAMLQAKTSDEETQNVEAIVDYGELAIYPLIEYILTFKNITKHVKEQKNKDAE